jgi:hypothetical protein
LRGRDAFGSRDVGNGGDELLIGSAGFTVFAVARGLAYCLPPGWVGASAGLDAAFAVLGAVALLSTLTAICLWPQHDSVELEH